MKTLVISSSLRKKNTYKALKRIETIHQAMYSCEYEYLFLKDTDFKTCLGCHLCLTKGEQYCPLKDDRDAILSKIESSDAVILASPNHSMNVNWLMKNYIDRFSYLLHRPRFFQQRFMLLITSGSYPGVRAALKALSAAVSGGTVISRLGIMNSPGMNQSKIAREHKKLDTAARRFATGMEKEHQFPASLANLLWFSVFKATSTAHAAEYPADLEYYRNKAFFTKTELTSLQRGVIRVFTGLFSVLIRKGLV